MEGRPPPPGRCSAAAAAAGRQPPRCRCRPARRPRLRLLVTALLIAVAAATSVAHHAAAHSFLTVPLPMSLMAGCRIGGSGSGAVLSHCGGPCPNGGYRADSSAANPAAVYRRGGRYEMRWSRNNHEGGFVRWALVPVDKRYDRAAHERYAFHWSCWSINRFKCDSMSKHRDCDFDRNGEGFRDWVTIPAVFPDGDYVLGWTWYGGGQGDIGHFGDYYDCSFVRVEGGASQVGEHTPTFSGGSCLSTVDRLGICWREPCAPMRKVRQRVPMEFAGGAMPPPIRSSSLPAPLGGPKYALLSSGQSAFSETVAGLRQTPMRVSYLRLINTHTKEVLPFVPLGSKRIILGPGAKFSLYAETTGDVRSVQWFVNGVTKFMDTTRPFTSAGDDHLGNYYPWQYPVFNRRVYVSVRAQGPYGEQDWLSLDMQFKQDYSQPRHYVGV